MKNKTRNSFNAFKVVLALTLILYIFNSCTIEKRIYKRGYYIEWHKKSKFSLIEDSKKPIEKDDNNLNQNDVSDQNNVIFELNNDQNNIVKEKEIICDTILLMNGKLIASQIITINDTLLSYYDCPNYINQDTILLNVKDIRAIQFANGEFRIIIPKVKTVNKVSKISDENIDENIKELTISKKRTNKFKNIFFLFVLGIVGASSVLIFITWSQIVSLFLLTFLIFAIIYYLKIFFSLVKTRKILKNIESVTSFKETSESKKIKNKNLRGLIFSVLAAIPLFIAWLLLVMLSIASFFNIL